MIKVSILSAATAASEMVKNIFTFTLLRHGVNDPIAYFILNDYVISIISKVIVIAIVDAIED